jgi:aspartyl/asparaginyl beta-hydroxylase (cupin superfamily)
MEIKESPPSAGEPENPPAPYRRPWPIEELLELAQKGLRTYNRAVARRSPLGDRTFFDPTLFPWIEAVESEWQSIRAELDSVLAEEAIPQFSDVSPDQRHLTAYGKWKTFFFSAYGIRVEENCRRCPNTMRVLAKIPRLHTAFFSILAPRMHIAPHNGPYGGVLRLHLALKVPEPREKCRIRVGDDIRPWTEGRSLVFDDTNEHEVWNETDGERVVLFVDFERPFSFFPRIINRTVIRLIAISPLVRDGIKRYEEWKKKQAGREANIQPVP